MSKAATATSSTPAPASGATKQATAAASAAAGGGGTNAQPKVKKIEPQRHGVPVTVQASEAVLKASLPHCSWLPEFRHIVDGKQIGYALRECGEDLLFVRFPLTSSQPSSSSEPSTPGVSSGGSGSLTSSNLNAQQRVLTAVACSIPRRFLVPVPIRKEAAASAGNGNGTTTTTTNSSKGSSKPQVSIYLRSDGKAILCVVCGAWDDGGDFRSSGYKCSRCVGSKSVSRLREVYSKLNKEKLGTAPVTVEMPMRANSPISDAIVTSAVLNILSARRGEDGSSLASTATSEESDRAPPK